MRALFKARESAARLAARAESLLQRHRSSDPAKRQQSDVPRGDDGATAHETPSIFVSYARLDGPRVQAIVSALRDAGLDVWIDTSSIEPTADWLDAIYEAVDASDAAVAFLSSRYLESSDCSKELDRVKESGKKVIPVALESLDETQMDPWIATINWIPATDDVTLDSVVSGVWRAVHQDLDWSAEHTRLLVRAREWEGHGQTKSRLLHGNDIVAAEAALLHERPPSQPQPTALQRRYVAASRKARSRLARTVAIIAIGVALISTTLAVVAFEQRRTALAALAESDFRRLSAESQAATSQSDALRYALEAAQRAEAAGRTDTEAVVPIAQALARSDIPLMHFSGLPDDQSASGGRQGTDVSRDGSTLAFATSDGGVRVIDLWDGSERANISAPTVPLSGSRGYQVGLDHSGGQLVRIIHPKPSSLAIDTVAADVEIFDLRESEPSLTESVSVDLPSPAAAVAFGPREETVVVTEDQGTVSVIDPDSDSAVVARMGTPEQRSGASYLSTNISIDASRVCTIGARVQLYQVDPPKQLLDVPNDRFEVFRTSPCIPEPCGDDMANVMAVTHQSTIESDAPELLVGAVECIGPDGSSRGLSEYSSLAGEGLVALQGVDDLGLEEWGNIGQWSAERLTGPGVNPPYEHLLAPEGIVRPISLAFAVPGPTGPRVVSVGTDGDIDLWAIDAGTLPATEWVLAAPGISRIPAGQTLSPEDPLLALGPGQAEDEALLVDAESGTPVTPQRSVDVPADGFGQSEWVLPDREVLTLQWDDGRADVHGPDGEERAQFEIDLPDVVTDRPARVEGLPVAVEGDILVYSAGSSIHTVDANSGDSLPPTAEMAHDSYCAVGASEGGQTVAAVTCGEDGTADLQVWSDLGARDPTHRRSLHFSDPRAVAITADGATVAVAFALGEVAVLRDGDWIHPPELTTTTASHNDYELGWVDLDPLGRRMVTRRDSRGIELWHLADDAVERVANLSHEQRFDSPLGAEFAGGSLFLTWNGNSSTRPSGAAEWSLTRRDLASAACSIITKVTESGHESAVPETLCPRSATQGLMPNTGRCVWRIGVRMPTETGTR